MVDKIYSISELPHSPAVYAMYGGSGRSSHVAYIGVTDGLKNRIEDHLVRRDSSVASGTSAVVLNPDYITKIMWWENPEFSERRVLEAAELVAFDIFEPSLKSRGRIMKKSRELYEDKTFHERIGDFFVGEPTGQLVILTLQDAFAKIEELEHRILEIEKRSS